jgi:hypothetical protein
MLCVGRSLTESQARSTVLGCFLFFLSPWKNILWLCLTRVHLHPSIFTVRLRTGREGTEEEYMCSYSLSLTSALDGVGGQRHDPTTLPPGMTRYTLWGGWMCHIAGLDGCGESRPHTKMRSPDRPARSECYTHRTVPAHLPDSLFKIIIKSMQFNKCFQNDCWFCSVNRVSFFFRWQTESCKGF